MRTDQRQLSQTRQQSSVPSSLESGVRMRSRNFNLPSTRCISEITDRSSIRSLVAVALICLSLAFLVWKTWRGFEKQNAPSNRLAVYGESGDSRPNLSAPNLQSPPSSKRSYGELP